MSSLERKSQAKLERMTKAQILNELNNAHDLIEVREKELSLLEKKIMDLKTKKNKLAKQLRNSENMILELEKANQDLTEKIDYLQLDEEIIPKDISVTGFDGIKKPEFALHLPSLTTIKQNPFRKGQKAIQALLDQIDNKGKSIPLDAEFVIGESTAEAPKR